MRRVPAIILVLLMPLLLLVCRIAGMMLLLRGGYGAVVDGLMADDWGVFARNAMLAAFGWVLLADVRGGVNVRRER